MGILSSDHPYKSVAPTVPTGTTDTSTWTDVYQRAGGQKQIVEGAMVEIQSQSFSGVTTSFINEPGGIPYDLVSSERTRLATNVLGHGNGFRYLRWSGGNHQCAGVSVDGKQLIEFFTSGTPVGSQVSGGSEGQMSTLLALLAATGKAIEVSYEEWSCATYWKDIAALTSLSTNGLAIPGSEPAYSTYIDELSTAYVNNMLYVDAAGFKVTRCCFFNEAGNGTNVYYGHIYWSNTTTEKQAYADLVESIVTKVLAATFSNSTAANTKFATQSWDGPSGWAATEVKANTNYADIDEWTDHQITGYMSDPSTIPTYSSTATGGRAVWMNETWYSDAMRSTAITTYSPNGEGWLCTNIALCIAHWLTRNNAPVYMPIIHLGKPTYDGTNALGYALTFWKSDYDTTNNTGDSAYNSLSTGCWDYNPRTWNAAAGFLQHIAWNSRRWLASYYASMAAGTAVLFLTDPARSDKMTVVCINRTAGAVNFRGHLGSQRTMDRYRFDYSARNTAMTAFNSTCFDISVAAYGIEFLVER